MGQITSVGEHSDVLVVLIGIAATIIGTGLMALAGIGCHLYKKLKADVHELYDGRNSHAERITALEAQHELNHGQKLRRKG